MARAIHAGCAARPYRSRRAYSRSWTYGMRSAPTAPIARPGRRRRYWSISDRSRGATSTRPWSRSSSGRCPLGTRPRHPPRREWRRSRRPLPSLCRAQRTRHVGAPRQPVSRPGMLARSRADKGAVKVFVENRVPKKWSLQDTRRGASTRFPGKYDPAIRGNLAVFRLLSQPHKRPGTLAFGRSSSGRNTESVPGLA